MRDFKKGNEVVFLFKKEKFRFNKKLIVNCI